MRATRLIASTFALTALVALPGVSAAAERCEDPEAQRLIDVLGRLTGGASLRVERAPDRVALVAMGAAGEAQPVLVATCDGLEVPLAAGLARPTYKKDPAVTKTSGPLTVSLTARGVVSLSIAAGAAARDGIEVTAFDDDSVSIADTRGRIWYARSLTAEGTRVAIEGAHVGCGCERTTGVDGRTTQRRLR